MSKPRREIQAFKGYDKRATKQGIGGVTFWFILRRGAAAITWELLTDIFPSTVHVPLRGATGGAVTIHAPECVAKDWWEGPDDCTLVAGGKCWNTKGYLVGDDVYAALVDGGQDGAFEAMDRIMTAWLRPDEDTQ